MLPFLEAYKRMPRQGPGAEHYTKEAFEKTGLHQSEKPVKILELGAGTGSATIALAKNYNCTILATYLFDFFLSTLEKEVKNQNLKNVKTKVMDMKSKVEFEEEFDVIWGEGCLYIMGFENAFNHWKSCLKKNG